MLKAFDSLVYFVEDVTQAAKWYASLLDCEVQYENKHYAFIVSGAVKIGFHPADSKSPSGYAGQTLYWSVDSLSGSIKWLEEKGALLYRGPIVSDLGEKVCMMLDPFGNSIGLTETVSVIER
ncbi:MAG: VOC family protein [Arenicella sp.]